MQLHYDAETEAFRAELRAWLEANLPPASERAKEPATSTAHMPQWTRSWQRRLFAAGWLVPGWPPELGGRNATPVQQLVYHEEIARLPVMRAYNFQGLMIIAPSILDFGNEAQKERWVMPTLHAEISWCLGMSEPGAGSDLAGLQTRAEVRDDHFVVHGQKIWTSGAHHADYCFCFVRTDPAAPKHRGISVVIVDMKSPGVDVRPMPELTDRTHADFNEVFFDGVVVPKENLVGALNQGWEMAHGSLGHERGMVWIQQAGWLEGNVEKLRHLALRPSVEGRRIGDDPVFRAQFASLFVDTQAMKFMGYRGFSKSSLGEASPEHSVMKLLGSETNQRMALVATEALGAVALDVSFDGIRWDGAFGEYPWALRYLITFGGTISAGTSEIQRNIIAQRVLGLPRR